MTRDIFREAFGKLRQRPIAILVVAVAYLPWLLVSLLDVPMGSAYVITLVGTLVSNTLVFLGLYMAVAIFYGSGEEEETPSNAATALQSIADHRMSVTTMSLAFAAISFMASVIAQFLISALGSAGLSNVQGSGLVVAVLVLQFLMAVLPVFILVLIALSPQLIHIAHVAKGGEALEKSYRLMKGRYAKALPLYLIPVAIATGLVTGISLVMIYLPQGWLLVPPFLVVSLIMGCMGAFVAACFNRFYLVVEEEEEAKRKAAKKGKGKSGQAKKKR